MIKKTVEIVGNSRKWVPAFGNVFVGLNTVDSNGNTSERVYKFENASGDLKMRGARGHRDSNPEPGVGGGVGQEQLKKNFYKCFQNLFLVHSSDDQTWASNELHSKH